jgi:Cof subfamily protein (haloacid dehalogenase superfamily)
MSSKFPPVSAGNEVEHRDIRMVAIDLDGTLLDNTKQIDPETAAALQSIVARGIQVVIASARPPRGVRAIYNQLELTNWQINYNGAMIWNEPMRSPVFHRPMPPKLVAQIVETARDQFDEVQVHAEVMDRWFTDRPVTVPCHETAKLYQPDGIFPIEEICSVPVTKLMLVAETQMLMKLETVLYRQFHTSVTIMNSEERLMQLMDNKVGKAMALKKVAGHHGVSQAQVMAIGDALNDVGMLQWAGTAVAMENAMSAVKKVAHWIAPANDRQGVLGALRKFGLVGL